MRTSRWLKCLAVLFVLTSTGVERAGAMLPSLDEFPWKGYFVAFSDRRCQFGMAAQGKMVLKVVDSKGKLMSGQREVVITIVIEEELPGGKVVSKKIAAMSLESEMEATDKLEKAVIRGKVTGDATFEFTLEQKSGVISMGGRILDRGRLTKNPLRLTIRSKFGRAYPYDKRKTRKEKKMYEKKLRGDRVELKWTDGKRVKVPLGKKVDAQSKEIGGPGIAFAEVEVESYGGRKFQFTASEHSAMALWNRGEALSEGYSVNWTSDAVKDPDGEARLTVEVK